MMNSTLDTWKFLAGLGIFLFGMSLLEGSLKILAGRSFKTMLSKQTSSTFRSIVTGIIATTILQSSSVVMLMILAFVGAGIISMSNALGIVLGSNLGSTFTGWIVASIGFNLDLQALTFPILALGSGAMLYFPKGAKASEAGRFCIGFGFLFLGLAYMKESMDFFSSTLNVNQFKDYGLFVFLGVGLVFAAVIQSSAAVMVITLSALNAGVIGLMPAMAIAIGADLGTTSTILIGAAKGIPAKKQVALAHLFFNIVTDTIAFALIGVFYTLITQVLKISDPLIALVTFHSLFNILGIIIFIPFLPKFSHFLSHRFVESMTSSNRHIHKVDVSIHEAALKALKSEIFDFIQRVIELNRMVLLLPNKEEKGIYDNPWFSAPIPFDQDYESLKQWEGEIVEYVYAVQKEELEPDEVSLTDRYLASARNAVFSVKSAKDIRHNLMRAEKSSNSRLVNEYQSLQKESTVFYQSVAKLLKSNPNVHFEQLSTLHKINDHMHNQIHRNIIEIAGSNHLEEKEISTLLNVNRELYSSNKHLVMCLTDYFLESKSAENLESLTTEI